MKDLIKHLTCQLPMVLFGDFDYAWKSTPGRTREFYRLGLVV